MADADTGLKAVWAYLQTVPAVEKETAKGQPPLCHPLTSYSVLQDLGDVLALIHLGHEFLELRAERVVRRDHAYWPPLFDYRNIAKPALVHHVQRVPERFVGADGLRIWRHHVGKQSGFRIAFLGRHAEEGVALGEYADKALLVTYHECADFISSHQARSVADRRRAWGSEDLLILDNRSDRPVCHHRSTS